MWTAFTTRQRVFTIGDDRAFRLDPEVGLFAAAADGEPESLAALAALLPDEGVLGLVEREPPPLPAGIRIVKQAPCDEQACLPVSSLG